MNTLYLLLPTAILLLVILYDISAANSTIKIHKREGFYKARSEAEGCTTLDLAGVLHYLNYYIYYIITCKYYFIFGVLGLGLGFVFSFTIYIFNQQKHYQ